EDIWVSRVPVPITGAVRGPLSDSFDDMDPGGVVRGWNIHRGLWAGAAVERLGGGNCLVLRDRDPYAQASAERVFPESRRVRVGFRLMTCGAAGGRLYVEVCGADGMPPVQLVLRGDGTLCRLDHGAPLPFFTGSPHAWIDVRIEIDVDRQRYVVATGGEQIAAPFVVPVGAVERLVIRTGPRSREPTYETSMGQPDLPGADMPVDEAVFAVDRVSTSDHVLLEDGR
ncbi:MAG TPA: hypothetical protein VKV33_08610, partial [Streptosporangiaceae bacterium]|nr:hypothetical protein [Streptosporangiaceae bacterium]